MNGVNSNKIFERFMATDISDRVQRSGAYTILERGKEEKYEGQSADRQGDSCGSI